MESKVSSTKLLESIHQNFNDLRDYLSTSDEKNVKALVKTTNSFLREDLTNLPNDILSKIQEGAEKEASLEPILPTIKQTIENLKNYLEQFQKAIYRTPSENPLLSLRETPPLIQVDVSSENAALSLDSDEEFDLDSIITNYDSFMVHYAHPKFDKQHALIIAAKRKLSSIVEALLVDPAIDLTFNNYEAVKILIRSGQTHLFPSLAKNPSINVFADKILEEDMPDDYRKDFFREAIRFSPYAMEAAEHAFKGGQFDVIRWLIAQNGENFEKNSEQEHYAIVSLVLTIYKPMEALLIAVENKSPFFDLLLKDKRIQPHANVNAVLKKAIELRNEHQVKALLKLKGIDIFSQGIELADGELANVIWLALAHSPYRQQALALACANGQEKIVRVLFALWAIKFSGHALLNESNELKALVKIVTDARPRQYRDASNFIPEDLDIIEGFKTAIRNGHLDVVRVYCTHMRYSKKAINDAISLAESHNQPNTSKFLQEQLAVSTENEALSAILKEDSFHEPTTLSDNHRGSNSTSSFSSDEEVNDKPHAQTKCCIIL